MPPGFHGENAVRIDRRAVIRREGYLLPGPGSTLHVHFFLFYLVQWNNFHRLYGLLKKQSAPLFCSPCMEGTVFRLPGTYPLVSTGHFLKIHRKRYLCRGFEPKAPT